jgi:hypothetical protein
VVDAQPLTKSEMHRSGIEIEKIASGPARKSPVRGVLPLDWAVQWSLSATRHFKSAKTPRGAQRCARPGAQAF